MMIFLIILVLLAVIVFYAIGVYNNYVNYDVENKKAFSDLGTFLQKRLDLIPNLVETVKGYASHESKTLESVVEARNRMLKIDLSDSKNIEEIQAMENQLTKTLRSLFALNESYPDLKANTSFLELQETLKEIESEIVGARRYYNATAGDLNKFIRKFPAVLFAGIFRFKEAELFKEDIDAKRAPKVSF